ncbi:MAG: hypothetical protein JW703_02475 [Candidatus Diapherotrites archaeon]|nr:hypothetical protein [Candidatus Diapherotrites archaeon]
MGGKFFLIVLVLFVFLFNVNAELLCSYAGPDDSEHLMRLTEWSVSSDSLSIGSTLNMSFKMQNADKIPKQLYTHGLHVKAVTPSGEKFLAEDYLNYEMSSGETLSFTKTYSLNEAGAWTIWPSYNISGAAAEIYGSEYWHSCYFYVCPESCECLSEAEAQQTFSSYEKCSETICGYTEQQTPKYCFHLVNNDSDGDGILNENDLCPNEAESFNNFNDSDGCYDEVPQNCSENELCLSDLEAKEKNYEFISPRKICGYVDYQNAKYCSEPKKLADLIISKAVFKGNKLNYSVKNSGEKDAFDFKVQVKLNGKQIDLRTIKLLEKGKEVNLFIEIKTCESEKEEFIIIADSANNVGESNEENNSIKAFPECSEIPEQTFPSLEVINVKINSSSCGYKFSYELQNNSSEIQRNIPVALNINNQLFSQDLINSIPANQLIEREFNECWNSNNSIDDFEIDTNGSIFNFTALVQGFFVPFQPQCLPPCNCIPGIVGDNTLFDIGYFNCFKSLWECPGSRVNFGSVAVHSLCLMLYHFYEEWPCPAMNTNFAYGINHSFPAEFTGWDEFVSGNVLGEDGLDELIVVKDGSPGRIKIYDGWGNLLLENDIRFTPADRLVSGDVLGDERDEIIIAVDDDASGDDGMIYIYSVDGSSPYTLTLATSFNARFTKYDALLAGDLLGREKEQIAIAIDEDDILYVYDVSIGIVEAMQAHFPAELDFYACSYSNKADDHSYGEIFLANVLDSGNDEIVWLDNHNNLDGKSKSIVMRFHETDSELELLSNTGIPFTKYDRAAIGDVLGDEMEEILIGIDEHNSVYVVNAFTGIIKVHPRRWTKYDEIAAGYFLRLDKMQSAVITDEDNVIGIAFEEELTPEVSS